MDDVVLVQRAAALDKDAFAGVYEKYAARLYDYLWWVLRDPEEASEALYETFLEAGARLHELTDPTKLRPWLFAIASDEALRHQGRQGQRERKFDDFLFDQAIEADAAPDTIPTVSVSDGPPPDGPPPEGPPTITEDRAWGELVSVVREVAGELTPEERAVLDLKYRQGLDDEELATAIGTHADHAAGLVQQASQRAERLLGTTVVAFLAQEDCPELSALLGQWDRLDADQRRVVEEHAAHCTTCGERLRRHIPASALLGLSPPLTVPDEVGTRVLEDVELAAHSGRRWARRRDGFPPPFIVERDRRRLAAAAAGVVILLGAGVFLVNRGLRDTEQVASVGSSTIPATTRPLSTSITSSSTSSTSSSMPTDGAPGLTVAGAGGVAAGVGTSGTGGGGTGGGGSTGGGGGGSGGDRTGGGEPGASTGSQGTDPGPGPSDPEPPAEATTTVPPDSTGPSLSGAAVSPSAIRPTNGNCTNGDPIQATVSVGASDPSGIASVTATALGAGGSVAMSPAGGGSYTGTIGPLASPTPGFSFPTKVLIQAVDAAGNGNATTADITIRCSS